MWSSLIGPAVVAAVIASIVSVIGFLINRSTVLNMHTQRLAFDREQAERRATAEIALAEHKVSADIALAEKRLELDQTLVVWRRRYDLAEQVLAAAYEARGALVWARARVIMSGEGKSRKATEPESDKMREARDSAFIPIERLAQNAKPFATLQALQDTLATHFGSEAIKPIIEIMQSHRSITSSASILMQMGEANEDRHGIDSLQPIRDGLWGEGATAANNEIDAAIKRLEAICQPILSARVPAWTNSLP